MRPNVTAALFSIFAVMAAASTANSAHCLMYKELSPGVYEGPQGIFLPAFIELHCQLTKNVLLAVDRTNIRPQILKTHTKWFNLLTGGKEPF